MGNNSEKNYKNISKNISEKQDINDLPPHTWSDLIDPFQTGWNYQKDGSMENAIKFYNYAAKKNSRVAKFQLKCLAVGTSSEKFIYSQCFLYNTDFLQLLYNYTESSSKPDIQCNLCLLYFVQRDIDLAIYWGIVSASNGYVPAYYCLALIYRSLNNQLEEFKWLKKAAENGYKLAYDELGDLYSHGKERNFTDAVKWYELATENNTQGSEEKLHRLYTYAYQWWSLYPNDIF